MVSGDVLADDAAAQVDRLASVLLDRSAWVYARLVAASDHGVSLQEETITESLLLDIAIDLPDLRVKQYTRTEESRNGADWQWEWWFHGDRWFGVRLQAKKLRRPRRNAMPGYSLGYLTNGGDRQVELLCDQASEDTVAAAYVFYNGPDL